MRFVSSSTVVLYIWCEVRRNLRSCNWWMVSIWDFLKKEAVCDNLSNPCMLLINHFCMVSNFVSLD